MAYVLATPLTHDALVGDVGHDRGHRHEAVRAVREVLVDLVGDHPDAALDRPPADGGDLLGRADGTRGVVRADEEEHLGAVGERRIELVDRHLEAGLLGGVDDLRHAAGEGDRLGIRRPVRRRDDHLVTRIAQRGEGGEHGVLAAVGDQHLGSRALVAAVAHRLGGDRLAQLGQAGGRRVAMVARVAARRHGGGDDVLGRGEVRLPGPEADDVLAGGLQGLGLGVDGEGGRLGDGGQAG